MLDWFFDEMEKIGKTRTVIKTGPRGGKIVGYDNSGNPIYAKSTSSKTKFPVGKALLGVGLGAANVILWRKILRRQRAAKAFNEAAREYQRKGAYQGAPKSVWENYKRTGDAYFGKNEFSWEKAKKDYSKNYDAYKGAKEWDDAYGAYKKQGGFRAPKSVWERFERAGDKFWGKNHSDWKDAKEGLKRAHDAGKRTGKAPFKLRYMPGLAGVKTKKEAYDFYRKAAFKHHPDRGGDLEKMKNINEEFDAFKKSPLFSKLAMVHWVRLARLMQQ